MVRTKLLVFVAPIALMACGENKADSQAVMTDTPEAVQDTAKKAAETMAKKGFARSGEIVGRVDGSDQEWETLKMNMGGAVRSTASFSNPVGLMTDFTLQGHKGGVFKIKDSVSVTFSLQNGNIVSGGALYFPEDGMFPHYGDHENSVAINIETLDIGEESARVKGTARGKLYRLAGYTSEPDISNAIEVDLAFDTTAYKE